MKKLAVLSITATLINTCVAGALLLNSQQQTGSEDAFSSVLRLEDTKPVAKGADAERGAPGNVKTVASRTAGLDMTEIASRFPTHEGPTMLYINFDGWKNRDQKGHDIQPFQATTRSRDRDIQEILYRTDEIFAPFNVRVARMFGDARFDKGDQGNTTVFVGGDTAHVDVTGRKYTEAVTPRDFNDFPHLATSTTHRPNSDPFDIAFVDPIGQGRGGNWVSQWNNTVISRKIAHEAGHTFGLAHILTQGYPDLMSYDTDPRSHFANRTFPVTDLNFDPIKETRNHTPSVEPRWGTASITTQNAYTYLMAVLGPRPADDHPNVADSTTVDPTYQESTAASIGPDTKITAAIDPQGDYDVFQLESPGVNELVIRVRAVEGSSLKPVIMVFDRLGRKMVGFATSREAADGSCQIRTRRIGARAYKIVIGAVDNASTGAYELTVSNLEIQTVARALP
jgi:hypothetical protein